MVLYLLMEVWLGLLRWATQQRPHGDHSWCKDKLEDTLKNTKRTSLLPLFMEQDIWFLKIRDQKDII
jgi:hypothetical protein